MRKGPRGLSSDANRIDRYEAGRTHLADSDSRFRVLIAERPDYDPHAALADLTRLNSFGVLIFQIIGQQISVPATRVILSRVLDLFGKRPPSPVEVLATEVSTFITAGVSARKAATIHDAAALFVKLHLDDETLAGMTDNEVEKILAEVRGIGPWTVQGFLVIALDRPDAFPAGDLAIRRAIREMYGLAGLPSEGEVLARAEAWRPYRALAAGYLISWDAERRAARRQEARRSAPET